MREIRRTEPVNGMDVQLSIDLDLQQYAERLLQTQLRQRRQFTANNPMVTRVNADGTEETVPLDPIASAGEAVPYKAPAGSVTVMNYQTGQILAMASYPTFDNRWFNSGVDSAKFDELFPRQVEGGPQVDPDLSSLTNRAIQGQYNMGSAFKVFVAYAALATGLLSPESTYYDEGTYTMRSIEPELCAQGVRCVYRNSTCPHNNQPCQYGSDRRGHVAGRVERRLLLQARRGLLPDARHAAAGLRPPVRIRRRHGHRPAVRVRRSSTDATSSRRSSSPTACSIRRRSPR